MNKTELVKSIAVSLLRHALTALGLLEWVERSNEVVGAVLILIGLAGAIINKIRQHRAAQ